MAVATGKFKLDPNLEQFATEIEWQRMQALAEHGSLRKAASVCGVNHTQVLKARDNVLRRAAQQGYLPSMGLPSKRVIPTGLTSRGPSILYDQAGNVIQYWSKTKAAGRPKEDAVTLPDPKKIIRTATLYDNQGNVSQQWVSEEPEAAQREALWKAFGDGLKAELPAIEPITAPSIINSNLAIVYPVGDHHLGMYAWDEEAGDNWDISIAEKLLFGAAEHLLAATPACDTAIVVFLGDFAHYDSFKPLTPTHGNLLDADSRFPMMVRSSIKAMRYMIEAAARRHGRVHVIIEPGNHDPATSIWLMECLTHLYTDDARITVDNSPRLYHYFEFGECLIGTHHGHEARMEQLPMIMATDMAAAWGRTKYRYWYTGHIHTRKSATTIPQSQDFPGCSVESFRVLPPADAWAAGKGYRPVRDMKAIVLHRQFGEVARHTVNPVMLE